MSLRSLLTTQVQASPTVWARRVFGPVQCGDLRRTERLVSMAAAWATHPGDSLPQQAGDPAALRGMYRLLHQPTITVADILAPHREQTRQLARQCAVVLLVQDATELDFTAHRSTRELSPIGDGRGRGFHLQTVLAVDARERLPLGVMAAECWGRQPAPSAEETRTQRAQRPRESEIWGRLVEQIGSPPTEVRWVHVADRGADCFSFFAAVTTTGSDVLVRIVQNRRVGEPGGGHLCDRLRAAPVQDRRPLVVPGRDGTKTRQTMVNISWHHTEILAPQTRDRRQPEPAAIPIWAVRVWEADPPPAVSPVEWLLATTVPVNGAGDAWERVEWYRTRWLIEDFHQGLKTGCGAERTQLRDRAALERRLAVLIPVTVRLLLLRALARNDPATPVELIADPVAVAVVARQTRQPVAQTVEHYLRQVARLGGYQGRTGDGPPGWRTLWRGWDRLEHLLEGVRLATTLGIT